MNPSAFRIPAIFTFSFAAGMSTFSCSARLALRMRVSMSAMGSVTMSCPLLPRRLDHARNLALQGQLPEADPAHVELPEVPPGPPAQLAALVRPRPELRRAGGGVA